MVLYWLLGPYAFAADLNDLARAMPPEPPPPESRAAVGRMSRGAAAPLESGAPRAGRVHIFWRTILRGTAPLRMRSCFASCCSMG